MGIGVEQVAEPTARVTALVFRHGAALAGLDSKADAIDDLGYRFGRLVYLLDAWEDFDRDARTGAFNALRARADGREWAERRIREDGGVIAAALDSLGAPVEFRLRLRANIDGALGSSLPVLQSCARPMRRTLSARWREALDMTRKWKAPLLTFALVIAMAFLFPRQARLAKSARECLSLGLNLMAVGGVLAMMVGPQGPPGRLRSCLNSCCGNCNMDCPDCCSEGCCDGCGDVCSGCDCSC